MKQAPSYSNQRVGIFVDVQNLYHSAKNLYHGRVNYAELIKHLVGDRQLIRAMAYVVKSEGVEPPAVRTGIAAHPGETAAAMIARAERTTRRTACPPRRAFSRRLKKPGSNCA